MNFASRLFNTIILLGAVQGFIVSSLLLFSKKSGRSNRLLSVLIFLIALASFNLYANNENWFDSKVLQFLSNFIPMVVVMPFGPLLYFYIISSIDPNFKITKKLRAHFYPVIIDVVPQLTVVIYIIGLYSGVFKNNPKPWGNFIDNYNVYADIPRWISVSMYVWFSAKYIAASKARYNGAINGQANNFKWLKQFIHVFIAFQAIWLIYLVPYVIPRYTDMMLKTFDWYPIYVPMAIIIYWLGIKGYMISNAHIISTHKPTLVHSTLPDATIKQTIISLNKAMDNDKIYLNPNLNLNILSEHTGISQKIISAVLNQHLHKSFNEFVNEYRIEVFKEKILQPETDNLTFAGIASECGFGSQPTFQRTFKQATGQSPSQFRKSALQTQ
ncbi:MAG TPA: helix-turn-helix domain-containing protein [Puia sp.]|jgi:AraC-like DNA-binding protein|nr:helix-turn-helix domain-containing protein [Puia sp.]